MLFSINMLTLISGVLLQIVIARLCGPEAAGIAASALAMGVLVATLTDAGFDLSLPRTVAAEYTFVSSDVSLSTLPQLSYLTFLAMDVQRTKHLLWLGCGVCAGVWRIVTESIGQNTHTVASASWQNIVSQEIPLILGFLWALQRSAVFTYMGILRGLQQVALIAKVENSVTVGTLLVSLGIVALPPLVNLQHIAFMSNVVSAFEATGFATTVPVIGVLFVQMLGEWLKATLLKRGLCRYTGAAIPARAGWSFLWSRSNAIRTRTILRSIRFNLLAHQALSTIEARAGIYLLQIVSTQAAIGYYAAALRFTTALRTAPGALFHHLLPTFSADLKNEYTGHSRRLWKLGLLCFLGGSVISGTLALMAEPLVLLVYGSSFAPSVSVLQVLAWLFVLHLLNVIFEAYLLAHHQERAVNIALVVGLAVIVGWTMVLLPVHGLQAVAWGSVLGQAVTCCVLVGIVCWYNSGNMQTNHFNDSTQSLPTVSAPTTQE